MRRDNEGSDAGVRSGLHSSDRITELDGIRGTAIAMVIVWHGFWGCRTLLVGNPLAHPLFSLFGITWTGGDLFFVLSGFLIGGILVDSKGSPNYFTVFYARRSLRIMPLYAVLLVVLGCLPLVLRAAGAGPFPFLTLAPIPWYSFCTFTQNLWMSWINDLGSIMTRVTWSLGVEEQFYLALPLLIRVVPERLRVSLLVPAIALAPLLRTAILFRYPTRWVARYTLMPCREDELLLGVLIAILLRRKSWWDFFSKRRRLLGQALAVLSTGAALILWVGPLPFFPLTMSIGLTWFGLLYGTVLIVAVTDHESRLARFFRTPALRWLGTRAYGMYLLHQPVQNVVFALAWGHEFLITGWLPFLADIVCTAITLGLAHLSWQYLEAPLVRVGRRLSYRPGPVPQ